MRRVALFVVVLLVVSDPDRCAASSWIAAHAGYNSYLGPSLTPDASYVLPSSLRLRDGPMLGVDVLSDVAPELAVGASFEGLFGSSTSFSGRLRAWSPQIGLLLRTWRGQRADLGIGVSGGLLFLDSDVLQPDGSRVQLGGHGVLGQMRLILGVEVAAGLALTTQLGMRSTSGVHTEVNGVPVDYLQATFGGVFGGLGLRWEIPWPGARSTLGG